MQNLCRALVHAGHEVSLLCQEPRPLDYDFVSERYTADESGVELREKRETLYSGRCAVYQPLIGDLLPVYVYDDYPGWRVKTFLDISVGEFEEYARCNVAAIRSVLDDVGADVVVTNHSVPGPLISRRALTQTETPYLSIVHGSALQYVARKSNFYLEVAREGLAGARRVLVLSEDSAGTIVEDFPEMADKVLALPGGVDTELFHPGVLDPRFLEELDGGSGRGPEHAAALRELLENEPSDAEDLAEGIHAISNTYAPRDPDRDAGGRLKSFLDSDSPLVIYVGKLIASKGVHALISAFPHVYRRTGARLLIVGFGTFREALEALTLSMSKGDRRVLELLADGGRLYERGPPGPLDHFTIPEELLRDAAGISNAVEFVGPLEHEELAKLLPAADVAVVPSIFPESFGLVAAEAAASGVPPFVADHSGLREAGGIVGRGLPFDLRVSTNSFEENLADALSSYLSLPAEQQAGYAQVVRNNSVEYLGWDTLAEKIVRLAGS